MSFVAAFALVTLIVAGLAVFAHYRRPGAHAEARASARRYLGSLAPRLPLALLAAECLGRLLPADLVSAWIGSGSGVTGVLIASVVGALLPGGPLLAFPLAIALQRAGAGPEALVALITAWVVFAVNRTLIYELPLVGARFTGVRLALSLPLPLVAGGLASLLTAG